MAATTSVNPPESTLGYHFDPDALYQATWSSPRTSKLLLEAGAGAALQSWPAEMQPGVTADHISITEQSTGMTYNASTSYNAIQDVPRFTQRFSLSYVTGSHNFKTGIQLEQSIQNLSQEVNHNVNYRFNNRIPNQITQYATPWLRKNRNRDMGIYAQDQWAIRRLTLNYGLRFDYFYGWIPAQHVDATPNGWVPARDFAEVEGHAVVEGPESAGRRRVRPLRRRPDGAQGHDGPLRGQDHDRDHAKQQPDHDLDQQRDPGVERHQWRLHPGLRPGEPGRERRVRRRCRIRISAGSTSPPSMTTTCCAGSACAATTGTSRPSCSASSATGISVNVGYYRNWYGNFTVNKNTMTTPGGLHVVLRHGADRSAAARTAAAIGSATSPTSRWKSSARSSRAGLAVVTLSATSSRSTTSSRSR